MPVVREALPGPVQKMPEDHHCSVGFQIPGNRPMTNKTPISDPVYGRLIFIQEFLKHPLQIGWVNPSSRFLERRIVAAARVASANVVVELGPGTGGTTRAILRAMPQHARLLSIEINSRFHDLVSSIEDDRLIAHLGSACELRAIISRYGLEAPNAVVSGIPFPP